MTRQQRERLQSRVESWERYAAMAEENAAAETDGAFARTSKVQAKVYRLCAEDIRQILETKR